MDSAHRFDAAYYRRFYEDPETRVYSAEEHAHLASFVVSFARWCQLDLERVLDVGAGIGLWEDWLKKNAPEVEYTGTEISLEMCQRRGYQQRDIARWRDRKRYDLVICQGVLQYLPDPDVAPAVANIAAMSRGLVYFEVLTRGDLRERADRERTDADVHVRNGSYYRGILAKHFLPVGCGLHWPREFEVPFWELDLPALK
jgi:SAM-dependent methyltransferase